MKGHSGSILYAIEKPSSDTQDGSLYGLGMLKSRVTSGPTDGPTQYSCILLWPALEMLMKKNGLDLEKFDLAHTKAELKDVESFNFMRDSRVTYERKTKAK